MKRALLIILGVIGLGAVIAYLGVTKHLAQQRADKLDLAWKEAEGRAMDLEADLQTVKDELAALKKAPPAPGAAVANPAPSGVTEGTTTPPPATAGSGAPVGPLIRYAATGAPGLTNLVRIEGTSTVHDWQVEGHMIGGTAEFPTGFPAADGSEPAAGALRAKVSVFIPVRSLRSIEKDGRPYSDAMDEIMYGKLLAETNRRITYTLTTLSYKPQAGGTNAGFLYEATGELGVAGVTNTITMAISASPGAGGKIQFAGFAHVKMTDFKISPPSPSLPGGLSIKTGDDVTLRFNWWVSPITNTAQK